MEWLSRLCQLPVSLLHLLVLRFVQLRRDETSSKQICIFSEKKHVVFSCSLPKSLTRNVLQKLGNNTERCGCENSEHIFFVTCILDLPTHPSNNGQWRFRLGSSPWCWWLGGGLNKAYYMCRNSHHQPKGNIGHIGQVLIHTFSALKPLFSNWWAFMPWKNPHVQ